MQTILDRLATDISADTLRFAPVIAADKWVLASGMQKSIRRGDTKRAASFALSLAQQDRRSVWRRLLVTAFEDIGIGNPDTVLDVIAVYKAPAWRREVGDIQAAVHLARKMASAVKSRYATEMFFYIDLSPTAAKLRTCIGSVGDRKLSNIILDSDSKPHERFLALWALAGTKLYPAKGFARTGNFEAAVKILRKLPTPSALTEACISVLKDGQHPLALFLPLAMVVTRKEKLGVEQEQPLSSPEFESVPAYAIDPLYTRIGIASVRQLQKTIPTLKGYSPAQLGETLFFIEGENIDRRLPSDALDTLRQDSIAALMLDLGLEWDAYMALRRCLIKHFDLYNDIRLRQFERSLYGAEPDLLNRIKV